MLCVGSLTLRLLNQLANFQFTGTAQNLLKQTFTKAIPSGSHMTSPEQDTTLRLAIST
jgi:hypothetical protein